MLVNYCWCCYLSYNIRRYSHSDSNPTGAGVGIKTAGGVIGYGFTTLNFIGTGNTFATSGNTVDISIAGGGGSGGSEVDTSVNGTTAVGVGSFAVATHRSASIWCR